MEADCAIFEVMSGIRPLKCYLDMLRKLLDCDGLMMLLPRSRLLSLKNMVRRFDREAVTALVRKPDKLMSGMSTGMQRGLRPIGQLSWQSATTETPIATI
jgi:hypothetical protein